MTESRFDPLRHEWVVIARDRERRPNHFRTIAAPGESHDRCPFCPGNEHDTTAEVLAARDAGEARDGPGWRWRVVTNLYPVVASSMAESGARSPAPALHAHAAAAGMHEVLIETPEHAAHPADYGLAHLAELLRACRARARAMRGAGFEHVVVFRNHFAPAGASLLHPHTQIIGLPHASATIDRVLQTARRHHAATGRCLACDVISADIADGTRVLSRTQRLVAFAPYASRFAYELCIAPIEHPRTPFADLDDDWDVELADLLSNVVRRVRDRLHDPAMNWVLNAGPGAIQGTPDHWRLEVMPRLARIGGFELGTGVFVNSVAPEDAIARLRE